jgi:hypothetical protein
VTATAQSALSTADEPITAQAYKKCRPHALVSVAEETASNHLYLPSQG